MQLLQGDLFADFPTLRLIIPHGGGSVPYHWGRFSGLAMALGKPPLEEHVLGNVYFDTCVYHHPGVDLLFKVLPSRTILFASVMIGAVRAVDPGTGHHFDDTRRYAENAGLSAADLAAVEEHNARAVYPRLDALLERQGR
jgi:4-oxalmesaconate hydratase